MGLIELVFEKAVFEKAAVNLPLLHEELAAALGAKFHGISLGEGPELRVHVEADLPPDLIDRILPVVQAHDASKLTLQQQAEADWLALTESLRKPWGEWTTQDRDNFVRLLAGERGLV